MNTDSQPKETVSSDQMTLKELLLKIREWYYYIKSKWIAILIVGILGGSIGLIYAIFKIPVYTATTTFVLEEGKSSGGALGSIAGLANMAGVDLGNNGGGIFEGDNILELYKSRTMIEKTLLTNVSYNGKNQLLVDRYIDFNNLRKKWSKIPELKDIQFSKKNLSRLQDSVLGRIAGDISKENLNVSKPDKKLSVIRADVRATDEFFAKTFNDEIVKNVNDFYIQTKTKKSLENVSILQQKVDSVRSTMNGAIYTAASVMDATPNLNITRQIQRSAPVQRSQFSIETNKIILGELVKNLELSKITLRKETPLIQVIDTPIFPIAKSTLSPMIGFILGLITVDFIFMLLLILKKMFKEVMGND